MEIIDEVSEAIPFRHRMTLRSSAEIAMNNSQASKSTLPAISTREPVVRASSPLPPGYSFLPKGNPYLTRNARRRTQLARQVVYAVVNDEKKQIGIRVPSSIHESVSQSERATRQSRRQTVREHDMSLEKRFREAILSRFPRIPYEEIWAIARHATVKRKGRVGRTGRVELEEKAFLATRAHIRHTKTDYDALLKRGTSRGDSRKSTSQRVLDILEEWGPAPARRQEPQTTGRITRSAQELMNRVDSLLKTMRPKAPDRITQHTAPANHTSRALSIPDTSQPTKKTTILSPKPPGGGNVTSLPANASANVIDTRRATLKRQRHRERRLAMRSGEIHTAAVG